MRIWKIALAGFCLAFTAGQAMAAEPLSTRELKKLFPGTYLAVVQGTVAVTIVAKSNGVLLGRMEGNKYDSGRWSLNNDQLCISMSKWLGGRALCSKVVAANGWYLGRGVKFRKI